jgi:hypothetical protein
MRVRVTATCCDLGVGFELGRRGLAAFGLGHDDEFLANCGIYGA